MGETQIYSQRLHGITEKRRILDEVDRIQRDLEMQKLKLQQLKRKSLRDRWLMDGLVPAPGAEIENPLSETEDNIRKLEDELESLQVQLVYLENPELKIENLKKRQKQLVNGDQSQQISDQKDPSPGKTENQKEHTVIQEEDIQPNGEDEKQGELDNPSQKVPTPSKNVVTGPPIPAPRGIKVEKSRDQTSPDHKIDIVDRRHEEEHDKRIQDEEIPNLNHSLEPRDDGSETLGPNQELKDESLNQEHVDTDQDRLNQNSECLRKRLELEEENVEDLTEDLEHLDLRFSAEEVRVHVSPLSLSSEDIGNDLDNQSDVLKVTLLEMGEQHENETQPSPVMEKQYEDQDELSVRDNSEDNNRDVEEKFVLVSIVQDQNEESIVLVGIQDQNEESEHPRCQEPVDPVPVLIGHNKDQDSESTSIPGHQSVVLLSSDEDQSTTMPCNDSDPSISLPCEAPVSQVQISQVVVISTPGHSSSGEPAQHSSDSSGDRHRQPGTAEASNPAESQPLLHKPTETDAQLDPRGTNTAETRDKNPPVKKKSCQCCVVM